jgi:hypothetical protein
VSPVEWSPCCPRTIQLPLTASPFGRLSRPLSTISQYDFHSVVWPSSPCRLVGPDKLSFEPNGSPVFTLIRPAVPPPPLRDKVGHSDHVRFRGYFPVHLIPAYNLASQWPLPDPTQDSGSRLLARLYRGRHLRRQSSTHLHGATRTESHVRLSRIRLPPRVADGKALSRPTIEDMGFGEPGLSKSPSCVPR